MKAVPGVAELFHEYVVRVGQPSAVPFNFKARLLRPAGRLIDMGGRSCVEPGERSPAGSNKLPGSR